MTGSGAEKSAVWKYAVTITACWTLLIALLLLFEAREHQDEVLTILRNEARESVAKDLLYRRWNASIGGLYAAVTPSLRPDPYLAQLPERDITSTSGRRLTLVNHTYMTRLVHDLERSSGGLSSHLAGVRPLSPSSQPDAWERTALDRFRRGEREVTSTVTIGGRPFVRLMRPIFVARSCLTCHRSGGFAAGDVIGGVSVTLPLKPFSLIVRESLSERVTVFGSMWLAGAALILLGGRKIALRTAALRASESKYKNLFETMPDGVYRADGAQTIQLLNPAAAAILGYARPEDAAGLSLADHWQDPDERTQLRRDLATRGSVSLRRVGVRTCRGEEKVIELSARTLAGPHGRIEGEEGIFRDITSRIEADSTVREMFGTMRKIIDCAPFGIYLVDAGGAVEYANEAMLRISGESFERFSAANVFTIPAYQAIGLADRIRAGLGGAEFRLDHVVYLAPGGGRKSVRNYYGIPLVERGKRKLLMIVEDVTDRIDAEAKQRELHAQLIQAQKIESIGRLAGGVAHDFNNILSVIIGYSDLALRKLETGESVEEELSVILSAGQKAAAVTHQLLAFSRKQILEMKNINVNDLIDNLSRMLGRLIGEDIGLIVKTDRAAGTITADPTQIEQVLINLAVNARDAMPDGGSLFLRTAAVEIRPEHAVANREMVPGGYVMISITDSGSGMSQEVRDRIFEPFFTTKERGRGTGLGLATVYGIIKQHKGYIYVSSAEGYGTTFVIYLPAAALPSGREAPEENRTVLRQGEETLLVVEDDPMVRRLIIDILAPLGYRILDAPNGPDAIRLVEAHAGPINMLVTDVVMPMMNGKELADVIKERIPGIKVLYLSGHPTDVLGRRGILDEGIAYLQKPILPAALVAKIQEVFSLRKAG